MEAESTRQDARKIGLFRVRLYGKLAVLLVCFTQVILRIIVAFVNRVITVRTAIIYLQGIPILIVLALIVLMEYLLYRRLQTRILRYTLVIDALFELVFTAEWLLTQYGALTQANSPGHMVYASVTVLNFTGYGWRILLLMLMTQQWQFRIVPPMCALIQFMAYAAPNQPSQAPIVITIGIIQIIYLSSIFYFEHKINFTSLMGNLEQEQWMKVNEFILDNIPENIAIIDLKGNTKFISENLRKLMKRRNHSANIIQFFKSITDIQQQPNNENDQDSSTCEVNLVINRQESHEELNDILRYEKEANTTLEDIIATFRHLVEDGRIKEKAFQVFNGKFKHEDDIQRRSMEIKISFLNQRPNKYVLLILRDTTQRDRVITLEDNNRYKDHLLASVSHELRTPLNGNINLVEAAINSKEVSDVVKENLLLPALKSSRFLLHLINDILDMSQIKAQKLRLVFQKRNLKETFINTMQLLELHAKKKNLILEADLDASLLNDFCTDHVRLSQIVLNLLNNSIKFTQKGSVKLSARILKEEDCVKVNIEDTGIGMKEEDKRKLFKDFTHIESKDRETLNPTGVGLGLKIAYDLAKLLGPNNNQGITVQSALYHGSIFSFLLENKETGRESQDKSNHQENSMVVAEEYQITTEPKLVEKMNHSSTRRLFTKFDDAKSSYATETINNVCSCPKALVVDDDPFNIMAYEVILSSTGVKYDSVYNGQSAIDKMLNKVRYPCSQDCHPYNIVFMDQEMPGMTGSETVAEIKNLQKENLLPEMTIVGCTAHYSQEQVKKFWKAGITEFMQKPVSLSVIKGLMAKYNILNSS